MGTELSGVDLTNFLRAVGEATGQEIRSIEDLNPSDLKIAESVVEDVLHAGFQPLAVIERFESWLSAHFPEGTVSNQDPLERATELLLAMQNRLESVCRLAGSPVRVGPLVAMGGSKIADEELAALTREAAESEKGG